MGGLTSPVEAANILARHLTRGSAPLHRDRGQHPGPEAGRAAARRGTRRWRQGAARVQRGPRVRRRLGVGLRPGHRARPVVRRPADDPGGRHVHRLAMTAVWDVAPHPDAVSEEGPGNFRTTSIRSSTATAALGGWCSTCSSSGSAYRPRSSTKASGRRTSSRCAGLTRATSASSGSSSPARSSTTSTSSSFPRWLVLRRLVPLAALATDEVTAGALRAAAVRDALQASKGADGQWRSSKNWVEDYTRNRHRRRQS